MQKASGNGDWQISECRVSMTYEKFWESYATYVNLSMRKMLCESREWISDTG